MNGRFPFVPGSTLDTPLEDFAKLFAPGGLIDGFFNTQLRPFVDTTGNSWIGQMADGVAAPVSPSDILQFQRAAVLRDMFFAPGSTTVAVRFDIAPVSLDAGASQVSLELDGATVTHSQGAPTRSTQITWPGPDRLQNVRLVFDPPPPGGTGVLAESGPWAMFRLFGRGTLSPAGAPGRYTLSFTLGNRRATFELRPATRSIPSRWGSCRTSGVRRYVTSQAMPTLPSDACAGLFGKLPARGDFVSKNLPRDFTDAWDAWWERGLAGTQQRPREEWIASWLEAPVWRFVLPPGLCGRNGVLGLWLPSVDKAGRYSPLTIAAVASTDWAPHVGTMTSFLMGSEQAGRDALDYDLSPAELLERIRQGFIADEAPASATNFVSGASHLVDRGRTAGRSAPGDWRRSP